MEIRENVLLAPYTTLGVGGPARYFVDVHDTKDVLHALNFAREQKLRWFVLGGGSNLLVNDSPFKGLIIHIAIEGIESVDRGDRRVFSAGAGVDWDALVARSVAENCAGLECLSGIPGTAGGTPVQNVGAYGQDVSETITSVSAVDSHTGAEVTFRNEDCGFSYRHSRFNSDDLGRYIITRVEFALTPGGAPKLQYADLRRYFEGQSLSPTLAQVREAVLKIRASKGMVLDEADPDTRSAGSFFKNPVVPITDYERIASASQTPVPKFAAGDGMVKLAAAWLIEHAGIHKGFQLGPVAISSKHTLAITNRGSATAADVIALKEHVQQRVRERFGVELSPEPVRLGFD